MKKHLIAYSILCLLLVSVTAIAYLKSQSLLEQRAWIENEMLMRMSNSFYDIEDVGKEAYQDRLRCSIAVQARAVELYKEMLGGIVLLPNERERINRGIEVSMRLAIDIAGEKMISDEAHWKSQCVTVVNPRCE